MARSLLPTALNICFIARTFPTPAPTIMTAVTPGLSAAVGASSPGPVGSTLGYGFLWPIARGLSLQGHNVIVITTRDPNSRESTTQLEGVMIHGLQEDRNRSSRFRFSRAARVKFAQLHQEKPFHILHSLDSSGIDVARYKDDFKIAVAFDVRATQISQLFAIVGMAQETVSSLLRMAIAISYKYLRTYLGSDRRLLNHADGVFVSTPAERLVLERYYYYPDTRIHTVPYGIDPGNLTPRGNLPELRAKFKIGEGAYVAVTITDMTELGELRNLFKAFERAVIKKPDSRLIVIGNGPLRKEIEFEMYTLALGNKIILTGPLNNEETSNCLAMSDIYINISSRSTGYEPALLEAMAQKKVVVTSELSGGSSVIEDGVDGFLIRPADVQSLTQVFISLFTGQIPTEEIGDKARKKVAKLFDLQNMIDQTLSSYFKILKRTGFYK